MATLTPLVPGATSGTGSTPWTAAAANLGDNTDNDTSYDSTNATGSYVQSWELGNVDADFGNMDTLDVVLRYRRDANSANKTWDSLQVRIVDSTNTTVLAGASSTYLSSWATVASSITTTSYTNSTSYQFDTTGYLNTTADKATWDGALVQIRINTTRTKGGNTDIFYVTEADFTGTYTAGVAATLTQSQFRWRADDTATLNGAFGGGDPAINTNILAWTDWEVRLRTQISATGSPGAKTYELWYSKNSGAYQIVPNNTGTNPWIALGGTGNQWEVALVNSNQFADDAATTELLAGAGTFVAGVGVETEPTASITLTNNQDTEIEWCLLVRKLSNDGHLAEGDTLDFRVRESDGTVLDTYTVTPRLTIDNSAKKPGQIGGAWVETPGRVFVEDKSGNYYYLAEYTDATLGTQTRENVAVMMKSTDNGVTWNAVDTGGEPGLTYNDLEAADMHYVAADNTIYIASQGYSGDSVWYVEFYTADHATLADSWDTVEVVDAATQVSVPGQNVSIHKRSDGTIICIYQDGNGIIDFPVYKKRSSGGTWDTTPTTIDASAGNSYGANGIMDSNDDIHIIYTIHPGGASDGSLEHKRLSSADSLSGRSNINGSTLMSGTLAAHKGHGPPIIYQDGSVEKVAVGFNDENRWPYFSESSIGTISFSTPQAINATRKTFSGGGGSQQITATLVANGDEMEWVYVYSTTGTDVYTINRSAAGTWSGDTLLQTSTSRTEGTNYVGWVRAVKVQNGSKIGFIWWDHPDEGATGGTIYDEYAIPIKELNLATTITSTVTVTDTFGGRTWYDEAVGKVGHLTLLNADAHRYRTDDHADYAPPATTTVMDVRAEFTLEDTSAQQTMMAQWNGVQRSWVMAHSASGYKSLRLYWSSTGADLLSANATTTLPADDGDRVQVSMRLLQDNGIDPDYEVEFWYKINSTDALNLTTGWTQLGTTITGAGTTTLWNSTDEVTIGRYNNGGSDTQEMDIFQVAILNGSTTKMYADFRTGDWISHGADAQGHVWNRTGGTVPLQHHATTSGSGRQTTGTVTVTVTDVLTGGATYDETLRATTITSTTAVTDILGMYELLKATTIASTVTVSDVLDAVELLLATTITSTTDLLTQTMGWAELVRATTITSTVAGTDTISYKELLKATTIASTVTVSDVLSAVELAATTIASTITVSDVLDAVELLATVITSTDTVSDVLSAVELLATTITSTDTVSDAQGWAELLRATTITSTVTVSDVISYKELLKAITIASTVAVSDVLDAVELLATTITSTDTLSDVQDYVDLLATTVSSTVTVTDVYTPVGGPTYDETGRATTITSTTNVTDTFTMYETGRATTITSTTDVTDVIGWAELVRATTIVSTVAVSDLYTIKETGLATTIASTVAATDVQGYAESAQVTISSTLTVLDVQDYFDLLQTNITATVTVLDLGSFVETFDTVIVSIIVGYDTYYPVGYTPPELGKHTDRFSRTVSNGIRTDGRFGR